jgi:hypothetical protein
MILAVVKTIVVRKSVGSNTLSVRVRPSLQKKDNSMCCSCLKRPDKDTCLKVCQVPGGDCVSHVQVRDEYERKKNSSSKKVDQLMSFLLPLAGRYL